MPRLEQWSVVNSGDPYKPPEAQTSHLHGKVYGHPGFDEGTEVTTSPIAGLDGFAIRTRSGSRYFLGEVHPDYEKAYPDAKKRLYDTLIKAGR